MSLVHKMCVGVCACDFVSLPSAGSARINVADGNIKAGNHKQCTKMSEM